MNLRDPIVYEINPRAFSPSGNFEGVRQRLDHLERLGVNVLWIMPIHPVGVTGRKGPLGSPYAATDYFAIDPAYGTLADLRGLLEDVHGRGMRMILDIAANHTACDAVLLKQHPDFYRRNAQGQPLSSEEAWSDVYALDYANPSLCEYMRGVFRYWMQIGFDGFRCDIAHYVPLAFWNSLRAELGTDAILIAEAEDATYTETAFDAGYSWKLFHAINAVLTEGAAAIRIREALSRGNRKAMRFTDNHDETRAIVRLGEPAALAASAITMLLDGIPLLYNGQEIGDTAESGPPALFDRVPIYWGNAERRPDFFQFYRQLIHLRRAHSALHAGDVVWLDNTGADRVVTYLREGENQEFLVAVNCSNRRFEGNVEGGTQPLALAPYGILVRERRWGILFSR
jgi:glycosidase